jgi:hypothetical protein
MITGTRPDARQQQHVARLHRHAEMEDLAAGGDDGGGYRVGAVLGHRGCRKSCISEQPAARGFAQSLR